MNEPIISPWTFYFIEMTIPLLVISLLFAIGFGILAFVTYPETSSKDIWGHEKDPNVVKEARTEFKITTFLFCLFLLIFILIPSPPTCYKMLMAQYVTKQNILDAGEAFNTTLDKAVEKIIRIQKGRN